jgi:hypothetical protein
MTRRPLHDLPFSGGIAPDQTWFETLSKAEPAPRAAARNLLATTMTRVNTDLLPPNLASQPETQAEPYLAVNPQDSMHLIAGYQESRFSDGGASALKFSTSFDGGTTWMEATLPRLTAAAGGSWQRASDPWVAFGPDNRVYFASLLLNLSAQSPIESAIGVSRSIDGGQNWSRPVVVHRSTADFNDKEAIVADTDPNSPHFGNVYVAWTKNLQQVLDSRLLVSRSRDGGLSWSSPKAVKKEGANVGAIPRVGPDGTVYLVWAGRELVAGSPFVIYFARGKKGGKKWSEPVVVSETRFKGVDRIREGDILPSFAVNPVNGDLYITWQDSRFTGTDQATLVHSRDGGESWSAPQRVSDGPGDAASFTTSVACNAAGEVAVSFYSLRNDPERRFWIDLYVTISRDGGVTFEPAQRVTAESFDIRFAARVDGDGFFLGDYAGLAAAETRFHLLWVSTHLASTLNPDRRQPDVFTASVE